MFKITTICTFMAHTFRIKHPKVHVRLVEMGLSLKAR